MLSQNEKGGGLFFWGRKLNAPTKLVGSSLAHNEKDCSELIFRVGKFNAPTKS